MTWITDEEYEGYVRTKAAARRNYIWKLARTKNLNAHAIGKGTGISASVVRRFLRGGNVEMKTFDKIRLFCERHERPKR